MAAMPVTSDALTEMDNQDTSTLPHQFVCSLCCDNVSTDESTTLTACNHQGCKVCMTKWIEKLEYSSQVTSPTCPFCRSSIHDIEVIAILGRPFKEREAPTRPDIDEIDELTLQWLTEQTTLCPGCGSRVEKVNGCDHMTCLCGCEFCFECGRVRCLCSNGGGTTYGAEEEPIRDANGIANLRLCIQRRNGRAIRIERHCRRCKNMIEEENRWSSNYERVRNIYCDRDDSAFAYNSCDGRWLFSCRKRSRSVVMLMQQRNSLSVHLQRYNSETLDQHSIPAAINSQNARIQTQLNAKITGVKAREILDSRGNPTVEVELCTEEGMFMASVPSGASTGAYEAYELRDGGDRYLGKGCMKAVANVNDVLGPAVMGMDVTDQRGVDDKMIEVDGTKNKSNMGANAILGVSLACSKAGAAANGIPLYAHYAKLAGNTNERYTMPVPCFNVINGGSHAGNKLAFQEYFVIPTGATSFTEAMQIGCEVYHTLGKIIKAKFGGDATLIGDEGGFAPPCDNREGCELIMEALKKAGYEDKCTIGLDVAASEFRVKDKDEYDLDFKYDGNIISGTELGDLYQSLAADYPIVTIEDPFDEDDWENWSKFTSKNREAFQVVGDDLTVTNIEKIDRAIEEKSCTCLLLKVNQIGTISESIDAVKKSKQAGWGVMTSHRSGETEDTYIADLAVGLCTGQIKTGAPCRSERLAKYNQLLRIEEELGAENTDYAGAGFRTTSWMGE